MEGQISKIIEDISGFIIVMIVFIAFCIGWNKTFYGHPFPDIDLIHRLSDPKTRPKALRNIVKLFAWFCLFFLGIIILAWAGKSV